MFSVFDEMRWNQPTWVNLTVKINSDICSAQDDFSALVLCILSDVLRPYNCFFKKDFSWMFVFLGFVMTWVWIAKLSLMLWFGVLSFVSFSGLVFTEEGLRLL